MKILFVCSGNTCRSAMCEAYFNYLCRVNGAEQLHAESAGTGAWDGEESSPFTRTALAEFDTEIARHRARRLTKQIIQNADLIIAMTSAHRDRILSLMPEVSLRTRLLGEFAGGKVRDITDPFGGGADIYSLCFSDMKAPLENLFHLLNQNTVNKTTNN